MIFDGKLGFWGTAQALAVVVSHWFWDNKWLILAMTSAWILSHYASYWMWNR